MSKSKAQLTLQHVRRRSASGCHELILQFLLQSTFLQAYRSAVRATRRKRSILVTSIEDLGWASPICSIHLVPALFQ
jgi:hypothetical protein